MKKMIVVDDNEAIRSSMEFFLDGLYEVLFASNGKEGLQLVREIRPDIVVTDFNMPKMGGLEMAMQIRIEFPDIPILFMTGLFGNLEKIRREGFEYVLEKPFEMALLLSMAENALR